MSESNTSKMSNKRQKTSEATEVTTAGQGDTSTEAQRMILPDDVWPEVLACLDHQSILRCCAVCRSFLHSSVPQLTRVVLDRPKQLDAATIRRFKGTQTVIVLCFIGKSTEQEREGWDSFVLVEETCWRLPTFLACLPKATKEVYLAGKILRTPNFFMYGCCTFSHVDTDPTEKMRTDWTYVWLHPECYSTPQTYSLLGQLVTSICAAYRNGSIPHTMTLRGLFESYERVDNISAHYHLHNSVGTACQFCHNLCTSLPVSQVMQLRCALTAHEDFELDGTEQENNSAAHSVCLTADRFLEIILSRSGGPSEIEKFFSEVYNPKKVQGGGVDRNERFYHLFHMGNSFPCDVKGNPTTLVKSLSTSRTYANAFATDYRMIAIIKALIRDHGFKPPKLSEDYATAGVYECAINEEMCTRDTWEGTCLPDQKKAFITRSTFEALVEIGFPLKRTPFIIFDNEYAIDLNDDQFANDDLKDVFYAFED